VKTNWVEDTPKEMLYTFIAECEKANRKLKEEIKSNRETIAL